MKALAGQVAVVTGSSRNIGREIALILAEDGCDVVVTSRSDAVAAEKVAAEVEERGVRALVHMADITVERDARAMIERASSTFGRLDILVCNAAIRRQKPFAEITVTEWREVLDVNLTAPFYCLKAALPLMTARRYGRVITIGGASPHRVVPNRAHVTASKMALLSLTRTIAMEYGPHDITANCIAPGHIDTTRNASSGPNRSGGNTDRPIARMGTMAEVASMVRYLCRPEGAYITGQCLHINGGMYMGGM